MDKFDFSKLGVAEVPTKEIEIEANGKKHKVTIQPLTGEARLTLAMVVGDDESARLKRLRLAITHGAGAAEKDVSAILSSPNGWIFYMELARNIIEFTYDFEEQLVSAKAELEKNSQADATKETSAAD